MKKTKRYYFKHDKKKKRPYSHVYKSIHVVGMLLVSVGVGIVFYFSVPVMLWKVLFLPSLTTITSPLAEPFNFKLEKVNASKAEHKNVLSMRDRNDSMQIEDEKKEWYLSYPLKNTKLPEVEFYKLSIPKLRITNATVSTQNADLSKHLVQYYGTPVPPFKGNTVIFGHSTLPQLFDPNNYNTIFANAHTLKEGDLFSVTVGSKEYMYKITQIYITTPDDISVLDQNSSDSYITIITCTPPGTIWKRLIIKAQLVK